MRQETITACCVTVPRLKNLQRLLPRVLPYVDKFVLVVGREDTAVDSYLASLGPKIHRVFYPWRNNFADSYNQYIKAVSSGWMLCLDDDELPSEEMLKSLDDFVNKSNHGESFCCVEFCANPIYLVDNKEHDNGPTNYFRQMLVRKTPSMHYKGGPRSGMHQYLWGHQNGKLIRSPHVYFHIKSISDEHRNAARNFTVAGIWRHGSIDGDLCPEWQELNSIIREEYPQVIGFMDLDDILIAGNISQRLKDWMYMLYTKHRNNPDMNEGRAVVSYYYKFLHPEELPEDLEL